jgi:hypothetical protein
MGVLCLIITALQITSVSGSDDSLFTAIIAEGGYYRSHDFYLDEGDTVEVSIEVIEGGPIDVYLMTINQFYNAKYDDDNSSIRSISYLKGEENERIVEFKYEVPDFEKNIDEYYYYDEDFFDSIYIIVDNRNCSLTDYDADSVGVVEVKIDFEITRDTTSDLGPVDEFNLICAVSVIIVILIIFVLIFYFIRESRHRSKMTGNFPQAQYSYQYPQYVQYSQYAQPYYPQYPGYPPYGPAPPPHVEERPRPRKAKAKKRAKPKA